MQIHSQIAFHCSSLLFFGSGVDAALRRSPHSHPSSYRLTVTLRSAGLTNLRVEVVLPHCTSTACNLSAPDSFSWSIPPQNLHLIHAISVFQRFFPISVISVNQR